MYFKESALIKQNVFYLLQLFIPAGKAANYLTLPLSLVVRVARCGTFKLL